MCCFYAGRKKLKTSSGWVLQFLMDSNPLYLHKISIRVPSHSDEVVCHINAFTDSYFSKQDLCFFINEKILVFFYKTFHCKLKSFLLVYCKMHILYQSTLYFLLIWKEIMIESASLFSAYYQLVIISATNLLFCKQRGCYTL